MLYLYDVWVNWFDGEEKGYNVCSFHEWHKNDTIDILEQVPCIHITEALYHYIENSLSELPLNLLHKIHNKTYYRVGQNRNKLKYAAIVTDGRGVLLFDTINSIIPQRKSRLIPKQEQRVLEIIKKSEPEKIKFKQHVSRRDFNQIILDESLVYGLTRRERQLKQMLISSLFQFKITNNLRALLYWFSEWKGTNLLDIKEDNIDNVWEEFYEEIKQGWNKKHEHFSEKFIKGNPLLEQDLERRMNHNQNI